MLKHEKRFGNPEQSVAMIFRLLFPYEQETDQPWVVEWASHHAKISKGSLEQRMKSNVRPFFCYEHQFQIDVVDLDQFYYKPTWGFVPNWSTEYKKDADKKEQAICTLSQHFSQVEPDKLQQINNKLDLLDNYLQESDPNEDFTYENEEPLWPRSSQIKPMIVRNKF